MIKQISIENFKSLKNIKEDLKGLNLLMGLNGMGKSSFIQVLLLLMQSDKLEENVIDLNGLLAQIGQGKDALYQYSENDYISFGIKLDSNNARGIFTSHVKKKKLRMTEERRQIFDAIYSNSSFFHAEDLLKTVKIRVSLATIYNTINLLLGCGLLVEKKSKTNKTVYEKAQYYDFSWKFLYLKDKDKLTSKNGYSEVAMNYFREQTKKFQYISAERIGPLDLYDASSIVVSDKKQIGLLGEYAAYYIDVFGNEYKVSENQRHPEASSPILIAQINAWLKEISPGVSINTKYIPEVSKVIMNYNFDIIGNKTNFFRPKNVGFGISYVLPIVLSLLTAEEGKTIIIENPESHIHPRGQAELGKLIALAAKSKAQVFVETHSDHILNGIRVAVKEGSIDKDVVNILYFDKNTNDRESYTKISSIKLDKNGMLSHEPEGLLDEWGTQLLKLL